MWSVGHAVRADREEGVDGQLYAAMGFVRQTLRSRGLTRKRAVGVGGRGGAFLHFSQLRELCELRDAELAQLVARALSYEWILLLVPV
jgi:hypothetical protein